MLNIAKLKRKMSPLSKKRNRERMREIRLHRPKLVQPVCNLKSPKVVQPNLSKEAVLARQRGKTESSNNSDKRLEFIMLKKRFDMRLT